MLLNLIVPLRTVRRTTTIKRVQGHRVGKMEPLAVPLNCDKKTKQRDSRLPPLISSCELPAIRPDHHFSATMAILKPDRLVRLNGGCHGHELEAVLRDR
jgi:hypothetical protein